MEYVPLWIVLLTAASCQGSSSTTSETPVPSSEVADTSRYKEQVAFINDFLRNTGETRKQSSEQGKSLFSQSKDNKTTANEVHLPAVASSVLDTLPVYPRIPRRVAKRRRGRQHRHSTRVNVVQPVRYLLPPVQNDIYEQVPLTTTPSYSPEPVSIESSAPILTSARTESVLEVQQEERSEPSKNTISPQHRRIFIPPPLRYLLPPFFYENYLNAQQSTTEAPTTSPYKYFSTTEALQQNSRDEPSHLPPIIVVETVSESNDDLQSWNHQSTEGSKHSTPSVNDHSHFDSGSKVNVDNSSPSTEINSSVLEEFKNINTPSENGFGSAVTQDSGAQEFQENSRQSTKNVPQSSTARSIYPVPRSLSSTSLPFLRGPNIEQTLFETGNFQIFETTSNDTKDDTVSLMEKPLLAKEVAEAGMKILVNMKEAEIPRKKFSRGKSKYNNLNQFNFQEQGNYQKSRTSKLSVAESSYYNDRRGVKSLHQEADIQVIPGEPGKDYPTLTQPPTDTNFSCRSVGYHRGYVADVSTGCQVFYICAGNGPGEPMLCPNGTLFSQDFLVCDWWYNVDCQPQT